MERKQYKCIVLVLLAIAVLNSPLSARWIEDGLLIYGEDGCQQSPVMVPDESGGFIVVWVADGYDPETGIFAQRVNGVGELQWISSGIEICNHPEYSAYTPEAVSDGHGGAIIFWLDFRDTYHSVYAQRIDGDGNKLWASEGIALSTVTITEWDGKNCIPDGNGGAFITWSRRPAGAPESISDICVQGVDSSGVVRWSDDGLVICSETSSSSYPEIASDGSGGAIIVWADFRGVPFHLYGQRINEDGIIQWASGGTQLSMHPVTSGEDRYKIIPDGAGGAFIAMDCDHDIFAQRIDSDGTVFWGTYCCLQGDLQMTPILSSDDSGGIVVSWNDFRNEDGSVYTQRVSGAGSILWEVNGIPVVIPERYTLMGQQVSDGLGNTIITWLEEFDSLTNIYLINSQKITSDGNLVWADPGIVSSHYPMVGYYPACLSTEDGGMFVAWSSRVSPVDFAWEIFAQKINGSGYWGIPDPAIQSIEDNPMDEGGMLRINLRASDYDQVGVNQYAVNGYNVWKRIEPLSSGNYLPDDPRLKNDPITGLDQIILSEDKIVTSAQASALGFPPGDWASVGFHSAKQDDEYCFLVSTGNDSTISGIPWDDYVVTAHTDVTTVFFVSGVDSGYSVDNLPPVIPLGLEGLQSLLPPGLIISWIPNGENDLAYYALYRDTEQGFEPGPGNILSVTINNSFVDPEWTLASGFCYILEAVDRHGNRSAPAYLVPGDIVGTMLQSYSAEAVGHSIIINWTLLEIDEGMGFVVLRAEGVERDYKLIAQIDVLSTTMDYSYVDESIEPGKTYIYRVDCRDASGSKELFFTEGLSIAPLQLSLFQNYPNPFNPSTTIRYYLPEPSYSKLEIFDVSGRLIRCLIDETQTPGYKDVYWDGRDARGNQLASGIYLYRLRAGKSTLSRKMILLR